MNKQLNISFFSIGSKFTIILLTLFSVCTLTAQNRSVKALVTDSLSSNPTKPSSGKAEWFTKPPSAGQPIGFYGIRPDSTTVRLDSVGSFNARQDTVFYRIGVVSRGTITTTDSLREVVIPVGSTWRIDSLKQWASNPSSLTYKLYKNVGGSVSQITNGNVSITSSTTSTGGLQNNTSLTGNTELWVAITGGTADRARIEIIFKNQ